MSVTTGKVLACAAVCGRGERLVPAAVAVRWRCGSVCSAQSTRGQVTHVLARYSAVCQNFSTKLMRVMLALPSVDDSTSPAATSASTPDTV